MSRHARKKSDPPVKPVKHIEVDDKHRKPKLILIVVLLALGVTLIATAVSQFLTTEPGWETIKAGGTPNETCAGDFVFLYLLGDGDQAPNVENREVTRLYSQATKEAFQIFHEEKLFDGVHNVAYLNQHPNEEVEIPSVLYEAFAMLQKYENKALYLAPIYREYVGMVLSGQDWVAKEYDPDQSQEQAAYFTELLAYTTDENAVKLELLGNNRVKLLVSQEYLQYAAGKEITTFIDFYWMKNAFIVDYLAQQITSAGYTKGTISSFDGFIRNLDTSGRSYQLNIFDRVDNEIFQAGTMGYTSVQSLVTLRNYPMSELAVQLYYQWQDGSYTSCHIDPTDGRSKSSINDLTGYSRSLSCREVLMQLYPVYVAETLDETALQALSGKGIETVCCKDRRIYTSDAGAVITGLYQKDNVAYTWQKTK